MKRVSGILIASFLVTSLTLLGMGDADAKRLGGGRSFGSRPSYSEPFRAPGGMSPAAPSQVQPGYQVPQRSPAIPTPGPMSRPGGFMGMLGGLALGGLLGSVLFGHAFQGINFLDILLFAGVAFVLFKLFAGRRSSEPAAGYGSDSYRAPAGSATAYERQTGNSAGFDTDVMFGGGRTAAGTARPDIAAGRSPAAFPADFDAAAFLAGAKSAYAHLQQAWDAGDVAELRGLTTDKVFAELQDQLRQREGVSRTELLAVEARILDVRDGGSEREASVLFEVRMREDGGAPAQIREVWHFVRPITSKQPTWYLDGIQQWED